MRADNSVDSPHNFEKRPCGEHRADMSVKWHSKCRNKWNVVDKWKNNCVNEPMNYETNEMCSILLNCPLSGL